MRSIATALALTLFMPAVLAQDSQERGPQETSPPSISADPEHLLDEMFKERMKSFKVGPRVIIGEDNRREPYQLENLSDPQRAGVLRGLKATALIVENRELTRDSGGAGHYTLNTRPYIVRVSDRGATIGVPVCSRNEPFHRQRLAGRCSAVLIKANMLVTAGHCIKAGDVDASDPSRTKIQAVFGYRMEQGPPEGAITRLPAEAVVGIKRIVFHSQEGYVDFAVLEVEPVPSHIATPIAIGDDTKIQPNRTRVGVIGYPIGLPIKYVLSPDAGSGDGQVTIAAQSAFAARIDSFQGNSGSPVVLADAPDRVVGIFTLGFPDFQLNQEHQCAEPIVYAATMDGQIAVRMSLIQPHIP